MRFYFPRYSQGKRRKERMSSFDYMRVEPVNSIHSGKNIQEKDQSFDNGGGNRFIDAMESAVIQRSSARTRRLAEESEKAKKELQHKLNLEEGNRIELQNLKKEIVGAQDAEQRDELLQLLYTSAAIL